MRCSDRGQFIPFGGMINLALDNAFIELEIDSAASTKTALLKLTADSADYLKEGIVRKIEDGASSTGPCRPF